MARINVNNLTFYYEGSSDNIFEKMSFSIDTDWKLGFIGRNGKGKTNFPESAAWKIRICWLDYDEYSVRLFSLSGERGALEPPGDRICRGMESRGRAMADNLRIG